MGFNPEKRVAEIYKKLEISKRLRFQREGEKKTKVGRYKILKLLNLNREGLSS